MSPPLIDRMRDIHDLDPVSWWPPAIGWWLMGIGILVVGFLIALLVHNLRAYPPGTWHRDARNQLLALRRLSRSMNPEQSLRELSELLRRIAITRLGRKQVAGLQGVDWLEWLQQHDPQQFPWRKEGRILIHAPYAPPGQIPVSAQQVRRLIQAALPWTRRQRSKRS